MLERVRAVPGVLSASLVSDVPLSGGGSAVFYTAEGDTISDAQTMPRAYVHRVSPEFFETVRIPLEAGRTFTEADATPDSSAVIVSESVARRFWPDQSPIGKRIKLGSPSVEQPLARDRGRRRRDEVPRRCRVIRRRIPTCTFRRWIVRRSRS